MDIFPAIDIYNGKAVFLTHGKLDSIKIYGDPLKYAIQFSEKYKRLHIVDLNGAFTGKQKNMDIIKKIINETGIYTQVGGGFRTLTDIENGISYGIDSIIIGTATIDDKILENIDKNHITASIDVVNGKTAINGWNDTSMNYLELYERLKSKINRFIYTSIKSDGTFKINFGKKFWENEYFIYAGGVSNGNDLDYLGRKGFNGAIIGKALYEGELNVG